MPLVVGPFKCFIILRLLSGIDYSDKISVLMAQWVTV